MYFSIYLLDILYRWQGWLAVKMLGLVQGFGVHARLLSEENACWFWPCYLAIKVEKKRLASLKHWSQTTQAMTWSLFGRNYFCLRPVHELNYSMRHHSTEKEAEKTNWKQRTSGFQITSNSSLYKLGDHKLEVFKGHGIAGVRCREKSGGVLGGGCLEPRSRNPQFQPSLAHKPCLASAADTSSAKVTNCGDSTMLRLPEDDRWLSWWCWGEASPDRPGDWTRISAPWSTRAFAWSRKLSRWLSIWRTRRSRSERAAALRPTLCQPVKERWW